MAVGIMQDDAIYERAERGGIAFEDRIERPVAYAPRPGSLLVVDRRERASGVPWHLWGMALLVGTLVAMFVLLDSVALRDLGVAAGVAAALAIATVLIRRGRPSVTANEVPLLWLHTGYRLLRVRQAPEQERLSESPNLSFDEVREVLYSIRRVPAEPGGPALEAAAVFVRLVDGAVWPVIPSTLDKEAAYRIAVGVAQRVGVRVKQVGLGWASEESGD